MKFDDNLFEVMSYYINKFTRPLSSDRANHLLATDLSESNIKAKLWHASNPNFTLLETDAEAWAKVLMTQYKWTDRFCQNNLIKLSCLLKVAFAYWKSNSKPTPKGQEALIFIYNKIREKMSIPDEAPSHLWGALRICDFDEEILHKLGNSNFIMQWSDALIEVFHWSEENENRVYNKLFFAHEAWVESQNVVPKKTDPKMTTENTPFSRVDIVDETSELMGDVSFYRCNFCEKEMNLNKERFSFLQKFSNVENLFCNFCIRHGYNTKKKRKDIFAFSFRAIIGYYYNISYYGKEPNLYFSEIDEFIKIHEIIGLKNPLMCYDPDSYIWFIDFMRVGDDPSKVTVTDVMQNIIEILSCFNPYENIKEFKSNKFIEKFDEAVKDFYENRYRPAGKRICIPTLLNCASPSITITNGNTTTYKTMELGVFKDFVPTAFKLKR